MTTIVAPPWEEQPTGGGIADAPTDGKTYGRKDAAWAEVVSAALAGDIVAASALPLPDVSIPFTTDGLMTRGKGAPVLVGTTPVAQRVTYERLGSQTMLDKSGRLVTVPAGEMAIEQQGLAIFDQSVNLAAPSINWVAAAAAAAAWTHGAADAAGWITVSGSGDPSKSEGSYRDFSNTVNDVPHTFSMDVLKTPGLNLHLHVYNSSASLAVTLTETTATGAVASEVVTDMGSYWRVEATRTFTGATTRSFRIYPFGTSAGATGSMTYRRVQLEAKPFATPYIENATSAQTTRPATTKCDIPWPGNLQPLSDSQIVTLAYEFDVAGIPPNGFIQSVFSSGGGGFGAFSHRVVSTALLETLRAASGITHALPVVPRRRYKVCYRINKNVCDMFVDGAKVGSSVTASPSTPGLPDVLRLGYILTPDRCLNGHLRSITIWNAPLTDIQCQAASS